MLENIWKTVQDIWTFLNTPGKEMLKMPENSFLAKFWRFLTAPREELFAGLSWLAILEFLETASLVVGLGIMLLVILGARGKVAKWLYWDIAIFFTLQIVF